MGKCRYDLLEDCHNKDCLVCVLDKIRAKIEQIPTYDQFTGESCSAYEFKSDVLDIIDKYRKESEDD